MVGTMVARFLGYVVVTSVQIFFHVVSVNKRVWCCLSSLSIQSGVFAMIFCITLINLKLFHFFIFENC